jgi:IS30 family transposase
MGREYKHVSLEERVFIETQLCLGLCPSAIARGLGRARTTVLRELRRNGWQPVGECARPRVTGGYGCFPADRRARRLAAKPRVEARMAYRLL